MTTADVMNERKCAHQTCTCMVAEPRRYCSDECEDMADSDPTSVCTCPCAGCKSNR
jgi:hypothetical protein